MQPRTQAILLVDDERMVLTFLETVLNSAGYRVYTACDAEHALEVLQSPVQIDLLITDVVMPGIDGFELAAMARFLRPRLPVVSICAWPGNPQIRGKEALVLAMLVKPFTPGELLATVDSAVGIAACSAAAS
jgi:DNA-binding response OmpR family regulator